MKRILCILLACSILLSMSVFAAEVEQENETPMEELALAMDPQSIGTLDMDRIKSRLISKRDASQDNLIFPGAFVCDSAVGAYGDVHLTFGLHFSGKPNQYYCMMIYKGSEPKGDAVAMDYAPFENGSGFQDRYLTWYKEKTDYGQYTVVTFTADLKGETLYPVEDSASMAHIYAYGDVPQAQRSFVMNWETGEAMDTVRVPYGETTVLAAGRYPLQTAGGSSALLQADLLSMPSAGGLFFATPRNFGSEYARFRYLFGWRDVPVEVCTTDRGHQNFASYPAGDPTTESPGYNLHVCELCGTLTKERLPSLTEVYERFKDVPYESWYRPAVKEAVGLNLFKGVTETAFGPNRAMTRAMLVTVLWRYEDEPVGNAADFTDVPSNAWYAAAVNWAAEQGIVNGVGKGRFNPEGTITREQLATILYRYAKMKGVLSEIKGDPTVFPDAEQFSTWAWDGLAWALGYGLITGVGKDGQTYLRPLGNATRAQVCAILVRYIDRLGGEVILPDLTNAVDGGRVPCGGEGELCWALSETGQLQFGVDGGDHAFLYKEELPWAKYAQEIRSVEVLNGVRTVNREMFSDYPLLESVVLADSVVFVEEFAFQNCPLLGEVTLSKNISFMGRCVFQGCAALKEIRLPKSLRIMGYGAFQDCTSLETVIFGQNIKEIGFNAFRGCVSLKEVELPDSIMDKAALGSSVFGDCTSLERAKLPLGLMQIDGWMFTGCTALKEVQLPYTAEEMGQFVFEKCSSLEKVVLPFMLKKMYSGQFKGCTALKEVYVPSVELEVFYSGKGEDLYPFGDPKAVTVYAIPGTSAETIAREKGYAFQSIYEE